MSSPSSSSSISHSSEPRETTSPPDTSNCNYSLEEYRTLREELLLHLKMSIQVLIWAGAAVAAVLGILAKMESEAANSLFVLENWIGLLLLAVVTPFVIVYRQERFTIARIATYIEVRFEKNIPDLCWTTKNAEYKKEKFGSGSKGASAVYFLTLISLSFAIPFLNGTFDLAILMNQIIAALMSVVALFNIGLIYTLYRYSGARSKCLEKWNDLL